MAPFGASCLSMATAVVRLRRVFGLSRETVLKMCRFSLPPGYTRTQPVAKPKLGPLLPVIDAIMEADRTAPVKQRHSAKQIFRRLRDEHGLAGGYTVVKDHVRLCRACGRETFVPLAHPPGHAQVDFGEAVGVIGGVCQSIVYDNTTITVAKILGDGKRERTRAFTELVSHYLFADRFGRPGKGNDKGKVEGLVKHARMKFMTPIPHAVSYDAFNAELAEQSRARQAERTRRHTQTIGERLIADTAALCALPAVQLEPCEKRAARVSWMALVRYRTNDYSVPTLYGFQDVVVKGFVDEVVILCGAEEIARHARCYGEGVFVSNPLHYLALIEMKPGALDQAAALQGWDLLTHHVNILTMNGDSYRLKESAGRHRAAARAE